jgi:hypothetical protein
MDINICIQKEERNFKQKEEKKEKHIIQKKEKNIIQTKFGNKKSNSVLPLYYQDGVKCLDFDFNDTNCLSFEQNLYISSKKEQPVNDRYCDMV